MLEKRVKRHVTGKKQAFFAAASPGLESLCARQIRELGAEPEAPEPGGVAFEGRAPQMYAACLKLSAANRVLMRVAEFKATHFRALEKAASSIPWELYLPRGAAVQVHASCTQSRLHHSGAAAQRVHDAAAAVLEGAAEAFTPPDGWVRPQRLFVRVQDDRFTLSLDASGELLHKRGFKAPGGAAPLRETLASAILHWAGHDGSAPLLDPMCGSGAFATEAALIAGRIPPGWRRDFAFFSWPCFREGPWRHLRRQCEAEMRSFEKPACFASDIDTEACLRLEEKVKETGLAPFLQVSNEDFLTSTGPPPGANGPGLIVINPPYGRRLGGRNEAKSLFDAVCRHLKGHYKGWRAALLVPNPDWAPLVRLSNIQEKRWIRHGGLRLSLIIGRV